MSERQLPQNGSRSEPLIPAHVKLPEITFKVIILGTILTIVLAAANAFLGLKVGITVSASIPSAVISMGILRFFRNSNVLENNMVQLMASVGEALTAGIAFILPALIILHVWEGFNYWQTVITGLLGGTLGVLFTIPLRRALLQDKTLRYPEGVAIGNILKASASREKGDLNSLVSGGLIGAVIALFQSGFQVLSDTFQFWVKTPSTVFGFGLGFSPALIAAGYIVGINVALSLLVGITIGWLIGVPVLTWHFGLPDVKTSTQMALTIWRAHIRYIGVGTMLVGVTRAMRKLYMTYAEVRRLHGKEVYHRPSRFLHEIPVELVDEIRFRAKVSPRPQAIPNSYQPKAEGKFRVGQEVQHLVFGDGTVIDCEGDGDEMKVKVRFAKVGTKVLIASYLQAK